MENRFKVEEAGRLDKVVESKLEYSRNYLQTLIKEGFVFVNGKKVLKPSFKVKPRDEIIIKEKEKESPEITYENKDLKIVYEDQYLVIIDKEAHLTVHPVGSKTKDTLVNRLLYHVKDLSTIGGTSRPGIVHRLDKDTSGLMIVAKDDTTHKLLSDMLKNHEIEKKYICLVKGNLKEKCGTINLPIKRIPGTTKMKISIYGRSAITHYKLIETIGPYSLLSVKIETGRTHQIRVHMAHIGHPIVGDTLYGKADKNIKIDRQFLHSYEISFKHPIINKNMRFCSALPGELKVVLDDLRMKWKKK